MSLPEKKDGKKRPRGRRRRRRRYVPKDPRPDPRMAGTIERKEIDLSPGDLAFINLATNPFGKGSLDVKLINCGIPDRSSYHYQPITLTSTLAFNGTTATFGMVRVCCPSTTDQAIIELVHGGADTTASSPTTRVTATSTENTLETAIMPAGTHWRWVASGLKIICTSSADDTSGTFIPGNTVMTFRSAAATYRTYGAIRAGCSFGDTYTASSGITVRSRFCEMIGGGHLAIPTDDYFASAQNYYMPFVYFTGLQANTVMQITAVLHLEAIEEPGAVPWPLSNPVVSPNWDALMELVSSANFPWHSKGQSFKSVMKSLGRDVVAVGNFVYRHRKFLFEAGSRLLPVVSALL